MICRPNKNRRLQEIENLREIARQIQQIRYENDWDY